MILFSALTLANLALAANDNFAPLSGEQAEKLLQPFVGGDQAHNFVVIFVMNPLDPKEQFLLREPPIFVIVTKLAAIAPSVGMSGSINVKFGEFSEQLAEKVISTLDQRTAKDMNKSVEEISKYNLYGVYKGPQRGIMIGSGKYSGSKVTDIFPLSHFDN